MKKLATAFFVLLSISIRAQSIFYYGNDSVTVKDFLKAYHKNNTGPRSEKAFRDYLDLYVASRLKIREAIDRGYDTLPQIVSDLNGLRQQILPAYLNDKESVNRLVNEAYSRAQKDIHLAHIFIWTGQGTEEQVAQARKKLDQVNAGLQKASDSASFADLAKQYSDDPFAKLNGGDLGWITVFTLPYEMENVVYSTPVGKTATYRSKSGFHIFKNLGERKDPGKMKAAQILLAFPDEGEATRAGIKKLADSLYNCLRKGDDFARLAATYSNDVVSAAAEGQMQEFGTGQYDAAFESAAFALRKDGDFSKPFLTSHGYHIVKRLGRIPVVSRNDARAMQYLRTQVEQSDRMEATRAIQANKVLNTSSFRKSPFSDAELWAYSDSVLNYRTGLMPLHITGSSSLFRLGSKTVTTSDWINFAQTYRYKPDGSGIKPYSLLWNEFVLATALDYYQSHLEDYNEDFRQQVTEFKEGNLFFEIMQRQVWGPAQNDSTALQQYYEQHKAKYKWRPSADAVIFYASDVPSAQAFNQQLKRSPGSWHDLLMNFSEKIAADSARFERVQIPNPNHQPVKPGLITAPLINKTDNTASFAYIIRLYNEPAPRSFQEARGLIINDYQAQLEKEWMSELEKKYPVRVNKVVVDELIRGKKY